MASLTQWTVSLKTLGDSEGQGLWHAVVHGDHRVRHRVAEQQKLFPKVFQ